ncbi:MAG: hypothetical protein AAB434_03930 [Planctomycetota bacterium]
MNPVTRAPYPPVTSYLWTVLRDVVSALLLSLAMGLGWFTGGSTVGPEDWTARTLGFLTFLLLGLLALMTLRALLLRAADTAIVTAGAERPRLLGDSTAASIGLGCIAGSWLPPLFGRPWPGALGAVGFCLGVPLLLVGAAGFSVRWRIAARAAKAPDGFDPRELEVPHAWWPLVLASGLLLVSLGAGATFGLQEPPFLGGVRGEIHGFRDLPVVGQGYGDLGSEVPYVSEVRSRAECWRMRIERPGEYRVTVHADRFSPVAILASEPRPSASFRRGGAVAGMREVSLRWHWDSQRAAYLIVGGDEPSAEGPYQVLLERLGP